MKSRYNACKHGRAAKIVVPPPPLSERPGAYLEELDRWMNQMQPRNVLEQVMLERACRCHWTIKRCNRYEDAAQQRQIQAVSAGKPPSPNNNADLVLQAEYLGYQLVLGEPDPRLRPRLDLKTEADLKNYDNPQRDLHLLCQFKEGVEWLLARWKNDVLPYVQIPGQPEPQVSDKLRVRSEFLAWNLLGHRKISEMPDRPLRSEGAVEIARLEGLLAKFEANSTAADEPEIDDEDDDEPVYDEQLIMRYEAEAGRQMQRAIDTFLRMRKHPELFEVQDSSQYMQPPQSSRSNNPGYAPPSAPPPLPAYLQPSFMSIPDPTPAPIPVSASPIRNEPNTYSHLNITAGLPNPVEPNELIRPARRRPKLDKRKRRRRA